MTHINSIQLNTAQLQNSNLNKSKLLPDLIMYSNLITSPAEVSYHRKIALSEARIQTQIKDGLQTLYDKDLHFVTIHNRHWEN